MSVSKMGIVCAFVSDGRYVPLEWALGLMTLSYPLGMNHAVLANKKAAANPAFTRAQQRENLAERALALGAEYLMCFDDDTVPPAHAVQSLWNVLAQHPEAGICGGIYVSKDLDNPEPLVWRELGAGPFWMWTLGEIFPCKGLGLGCMLIRLSALAKLPKPWFQDKQESPIGRTDKVGDLEIAITGDAGTDDLHLCRLMSEAGYVIYAHGGVLPEHWDQQGNSFHLPENSYPVVSYLEKKAQMEAEGKKATNREGMITKEPGQFVVKRAMAPEPEGKSSSEEKS